jgi:aminocarboxymuconate-semialdehyde decarboxylase
MQNPIDRNGGRSIPPQRIPRIDVHTHILPRNLDICKTFSEHGFLTLNTDSNSATGTALLRSDGSVYQPVSCKCYDKATRLEEMQSFQVDVQVLSTMPVMFSYWSRVKADAVKFARFLNDDLAETCRQHPTKFVGLGTLPMQFPDEAVLELRRCMTDLGMRGVQIGSRVEALHLSDSSFLPIWEEAERLSACIFVHPWSTAPGKELNWEPWLIGMPTESCQAICHVMLSGILDKFPKLRICFAHGGGTFPSLVGRLRHGITFRPELFPSVNATSDCELAPGANVQSNQLPIGRFWVDSLVYDPDLLELVIAVIGSDRVLLGSDYPFALGVWSPGEMIASHHFTDEIKSKLLFRNACEFLAIDFCGTAI